MKKVNLLILLIVSLSLFAFFANAKMGLNFDNVNYLFSSDKAELYKQTENFLEDIKFKDFKKAATYHSSEDQEKANIPKLIESKFHIKPELLDIREIKIQQIEIDRSGDRARVQTMVHTKLLNSKELRDIESIFYWHKKEGKWYMQLKSSL